MRCFCPGALVAKFFLTTAIDYSNGDPHLGHALEKVGADAIARTQVLRTYLGGKLVYARDTPGQRRGADGGTGRTTP